MCQAAVTNMALAGYYIAEHASQWRRGSGGSSPKQWRTIDGRNDADAWVDCDSDYGIHGNGVNLARLWTVNTGGPWTATAPVPWLPPDNINTSFWTSHESYVFYSANYINWLNDNSTISQSRLEIVQLVATNTINQLAVDDKVNVGLMQFSNNTDGGCGTTGTSEGGMVLSEMGPVAANRANLVAYDRGAQRRRLHAAFRVHVRGLPVPERQPRGLRHQFAQEPGHGLAQRHELRARRRRTPASTRARSRSPARRTSSSC